MMNKKRLNYVSLIGVASVLACVAQAEDTVVPPRWDVNPYSGGLEIESFNAAQPPTWASTEALVTGTARANSRFWYNDIEVGTALNFATRGITNIFSGAKIQIGTPIFIEMRCKLNPFDTTPPAMEPNTILCFYANQNSNLVVASATECKTNSATVIPSQYYPIMVRFAADKFDVFFNNETENATLSLASTTNEISKMVISGAGEMDDLYVSYGNPRRTTANSGIALGWTPSGEEEVVVANWLASKATSGTFTKDNAEKFYLTDTAPTGGTFDGELGVGSFSYNPSTLQVTVDVTLKISSVAKKTGKINGILQLKGAATYEAAKTGGASWVDIAADAKVGEDDFVDGVATYTFTLPNDNYKFFLPVIKSQITQ